MTKSGKTVALMLTAICILSLTFAGADDQAKTKGMIISRSSDILLVKGPRGKTPVLLTETTEVLDYQGLFDLGTEHLGSAVLIPGLRVTVFGKGNEGDQVVASKIVVEADDLETAEMIQAGLHPTAKQVAANVQLLETHKQHLGEQEAQLASQKESIASNRQQIEENISDIEKNTQRFAQLADYDVKAQATLKFKVGSSRIAPEDEEQLKQLAQTAAGLKGYNIEVTGYADSNGSAEMNTRLSENRAKAVITYLVQQGNVPMRYIIAPGAMGEYGPTASNETQEGRAENRRVEVKVLVNKGISGS